MFRIGFFLAAVLLGEPLIAQTAPTEVPPSPAPQAAALPDGLTILAAIEQTTTAAIAKAERSVVAIARVRKDKVPCSSSDGVTYSRQRRV